MDRTTALVVLVLGTLVLVGSATGVVLGLRAESGNVPLSQVLVALLAGVAMLRAAGVLARERDDA